MKKKYVASSKDKKDWITFIKQIGNINAKEVDNIEQNIKVNNVRKLDLHGLSLSEANNVVEKFILESYDSGCKKLLIITGKGLRSKFKDNPYLSEKLSVLKYTVPEYIKNKDDLNNKISRMSKADLKDGGEGTICIFLKNNKKFIR